MLHPDIRCFSFLTIETTSTMRKLKQLLVILLIFSGSAAHSQSFYIYSSPPMVCYGDHVNLYVDLAQLPPGDWRFDWYRDNLNCATGVATFQVHATGTIGYTYAFETGLYSCIGYDVSQPQNAYSMNNIMVRVLPNPAYPGSPQFLPAPFYNSPTTCVTSVNLCVPDNFGADAPNYRWYKDNVLISGASGGSYSATTTGYYKYQIVYGCNSPFSDSVYVQIGTGITRQIAASGPTTFCQGGSVVLQASTGTGYTHQWHKNGTPIAGATATSYTASTSGNYTCYIGNATCSSGPSNAINVYVSNNPFVSITGLDATYLVSGPADTLTGSPGGGTFSGAGISGNVFQPSVAGIGTHTISYSYTNTSGCTGTTTRSTNVCGPLVAQITANGSTTFCQGSNVMLSAQTGTGLFYQWYRDGIMISGASTYNYYANQSGNYTCQVMHNICGSSLSNAITVTVNPLPTVSFSGLASNYSTASAPATLTGSPSGGTFSGPGISGNVFSPSVAGVGTHTISYSYTNSNGCSRTIQRSTTVSFCNVAAAPAAISGNLTPCANSTGVVYTCTPVSGATSYNWTVPGNVTIVSGQGTNSVTLNFGASLTQATISVSANNGCAWSSNTSITVYNIPISPLTLTGQTEAVCAGSTNRVYSVSPSPGATSYSWTSTGGITITSGQGTSQITANFGQNFSSGKLTVTASNACGTSGPSTWTIRSKPATPGAISGPGTFCSNQQGVVYSISPVAGATYYNWLVPSGATIVSGQGTTSITVNYGTKAGYIKVAAGNACGLGTYKQLKVSKTCRVGVFEEKYISEKPSVFPNPSSGIFNVLTTLDEGEQAILRVFDLNGRQILSTEIHGPEYQIDAADWTPGVYQMTLTNGTLDEKMKIVKTQ